MLTTPEVEFFLNVNPVDFLLLVEWEVLVHMAGCGVLVSGSDLKHSAVLAGQIEVKILAVSCDCLV